ncbi:hypothetical protein CAPTEDRAFT_223455 [Capitella teleta]|uniref:Uncharacterized protein n=1 Tax=Capitella teleta TaxID=283909 RepID=R7U1C9_CAPTE|nr:hypothetical protein CAPTEDRAFT_223455 [Capitella teleta]|eukprot:ELT96995.1 hypothetical protein CAPTEDRAFT_223455 [Capitella teleta]
MHLYDWSLEEDLPVETIIIVACVCGGIVVILSIVLIVLCCRRYQAKKEYEKAEANQRMQPVLSPSSGMQNRNKQVSGIDNQGMDTSDGVFSTSSSVAPHGSTEDSELPCFDGLAFLPADYPVYSKPHVNGYLPNGYPAQTPNGHRPNGAPPPPPSYDDVADPRSLNRENSNRNSSKLNNKNLIHMQNMRQHDRSQSPVMRPEDPYSRDRGGESGVSTPDPSKPKKAWRLSQGPRPEIFKLVNSGMRYDYTDYWYPVNHNAPQQHYTSLVLPGRPTSLNSEHFHESTHCSLPNPVITSARCDICGATSQELCAPYQTSKCQCQAVYLPSGTSKLDPCTLNNLNRSGSLPREHRLTTTFGPGQQNISHEEIVTSFIESESSVDASPKIPIVEDEDGSFYFKIDPKFIDAIVPPKKRAARHKKRRSVQNISIIDAYDESGFNVNCRSFEYDDVISPSCLSFAVANSDESPLDNWSMASANQSSASNSKYNTIKSSRSDRHVHFEDDAVDYSSPIQFPVKNKFLVEKYLNDGAVYDDGRPETPLSETDNEFAEKLNQKLREQLHFAKQGIPRERFLTIETLKTLQETQKRLVEVEKRNIQEKAPDLKPVFF